LRGWSAPRRSHGRIGHQARAKPSPARHRARRRLRWRRPVPGHGDGCRDEPGLVDFSHPACMGLSLSRGITPFLSSLSFHSFVRVRRETGKKSVVRVHHGEGVGAAKLAAVLAGESPANRRSPDAVVVISSSRKGDRLAESLEVKAPVGRRECRSDPYRGASNLTGRSNCAN
jgi:hypothetical protein